MMEMIIVVIIIGILSRIAITQYASYRENAADKEAQSTLKLLQAAERIYAMETGGTYYITGAGTAAAVIADINTNLKVDISANANRLWDYSISTQAAPRFFCAVARRTLAPNRQWSYVLGDVDGSPNAGNGCTQ